MLVAPAATGALLARRLGTMMGIATGTGALSVVVGLLMSYHFDLAAGASVVLVAVAIFLVVLVARGLRSGAPAADLPHGH
jgi:ABC-type Mn2+/Zn2+ transport system permease subunit